MFKKEKIRNLAVVIIQKENKVLTAKGYDKHKDEVFYRLLGGGIDFGEVSSQAIKRELKEELGVELENVSLLKVIENIFEFDNEKGHEVCFVFKADFKDREMYKKDTFKILDSIKDGIVEWVDIGSENLKIYPEGVLNIIQQY